MRGWCTGGRTRKGVPVSDRAYGEVRQGSGRAAGKFEAVGDGFGYTPFPGTLNLRVAAADKQRMLDAAVIVGPKVGKHDRFLPCTVAGVAGHVHFAGGRNSIEIVAPVRLRDYVSDGDTLEVRF